MSESSHPPLIADRVHALDALRGLALLLGVALHATMSYLPGAEHWWIVSETHTSATLAGLFYVIHVFRMPLFFLIAGYFAHMSLHRLGWQAFGVDRSKRILVPLMAAWPLAFTGIVVAVVWAAWLKGGGSFPKDSPPGPKFTADDFPLLHLWFLYVLTIYYIVAVAARTVLAAVDRRAHVVGVLDAAMRFLFGPWAAPLLALPLAALLATHDGWFAWFGVPTPDQSLYPNTAALVGFGLAFTVGYLLHRQPVLLQRISKAWLWNLLLAVLAIGVCLSIVGLTPSLSPAQPGQRTLIYALAYAIASWAMTLALVGLCLRYLSRPHLARRYLADASYWIYLVHLPLVMLLQVVASQFNWPWWVEYPLALTVAMLIMLLSYHWLVRSTWIGACLNGRRLKRKPSSDAAPSHTGPAVAR